MFASVYTEHVQYTNFRTLECRIREKRKRIDPEYFVVTNYDTLNDLPEKYTTLSSGEKFLGMLNFYPAIIHHFSKSIMDGNMLKNYSRGLYNT